MGKLHQQDLDDFLRTKWARKCGNLVRSRRELLNLTPAQLAEAAGVSRPTLSKIENGKLLPRDYMRISVAHSLGCRVDDLWPWPSREKVVEVAEEFAIAGAAA